MMIKDLSVLKIICILCLLIFNFSGCSQENNVIHVSLEEREKLPKVEGAAKEKSVRIAVGAMITPRDGYAYYKQLLDYISEKTGRTVKLVDRDSYSEINNLLRKGLVDIAFVCGGPYVVGHDEFGMELLVAPQVNGETVYYSYIIVPADSPVDKFEELRGKTFAFTDPNSNSGKLVPDYMLAKMNETPDSFFMEYIFTFAHDKSIKAVANKLVDGAAVDSLIWEYYKKTIPELTSRTRVIMKSDPYGIPPVVVSPYLAPEFKSTVKEILLNIHKDEDGRGILKGMMIDKFVAKDDASYNSIREIRSFIEENQANK